MDNAAHAFEQQREAMHRQMLSAVSHDLKTPLAAIIGSLEVVERLAGMPAEKRGALIKVALEEAYRLDAFISNVLDMARLENGLIKIRRETAELNEIVRHCLQRMGNRLSAVEISVEGQAPVETLTDPVLLTRCLSLVIDNAVKFGGNPAIIRIACKAEDGKGRISVSDNGRGVPEDQRAEIFSKYSRFNTEGRSGTGLGLAIARGIMQLLEGSIEVGASSGGGAAFTLCVPLSSRTS